MLCGGLGGFEPPPQWRYHPQIPLLSKILSAQEHGFIVKRLRLVNLQYLLVFIPAKGIIFSPQAD